MYLLNDSSSQPTLGSCPALGFANPKGLHLSSRPSPPNSHLYTGPTPSTTASAPPTPYFRYHILVILVVRIFLCSWKMPYMSASLVGGHPGT